MSNTTEQLLAAFLVPGTVQQATEGIKKELGKPEFVPQLLQLVCGCPRPEIRQLAAVLLRKVILKAWGKLPAEFKTHLKQALLKQIADEHVHIVRVNIAHVVSAIGKISMNEWGGELLNFLNQCANSPNADHREVAMLVFYSLLDNVGNSLTSYFSQFVVVLQKGLADPESLKVRVRALKAVMALSQIAEEQEHYNAFKALLAPIVGTVQEALKMGNDEAARVAMELFHDLVECGLVLNNDEIPGLVRFVLSLAGSQDLDVMTRSQALDFIHYVSKIKPKVMTKSNLVVEVLRVVVPMAAEEEEADVDPEQSVCNLAVQQVDSLAMNLPFKFVYRAVLDAIKPFTESRVARERKAALLVLGIMSEGCEEPMRRHLDQLLPFVFNSFTDPELVVREAACVSFGQFAEHLQPEILKYHREAMEFLVKGLDTQEDSVKEKITYAIEVFTENLSSDELIVYLPHLVPRLIREVTNSQKPGVREICVAALAATAQSAKEKFSPYAQQVLGVMDQIMNQTAEEYLDLRASATDCVGSVAQAIGPAAFQPYLQSFLKKVLDGLATIENHRVREMSYQFFSSVAWSMKEGFAPILPEAMAYVIASLESREGIVAEEDSDDEEDGPGIFKDIDEEEEEDEKRIRSLSVRTGFIDEQLAAAWAIRVFFDECGMATHQFMDRALKALESLTKYFNGDMRSRTVAALGAMVMNVHKALKPQGWQYIPGLPPKQQLTDATTAVMNKILPLVVDVAAKDDEKDVVGGAMSTLGEVIEELGPNVVADRVDQLASLCAELLNTSHSCQRHEDVGEIDQDEESRAQEELLFDGVSALICSMAKAMGPDFKVVFAKLHPLIMKLAGHRTSRGYRAIGIGCLADSLKAMGPVGSDYVESAMPLALEGVKQDEDMAYKRNAAFTLGVLYEIAPQHPILLTRVMDVLSALQPIFAPCLSNPPELDGLSEEEEGVLDNATGCVARMLMALPLDQFPVDKVVPVLFAALPIKMDHNESPTVCKCIGRLLFTPSVEPLLRPYLDRIMTICLTEMTNEDDTVTDEDKKSFMGFLEPIAKQLGGARMKAICDPLSSNAKAQDLVRHLMTTVA